MSRLWQVFRGNQRQVAVMGALAFASLVCVGLLAARTLYTRDLYRYNLAWNLFLAWLPLACALAAYNLSKRSARRRWPLIAVCAFLWLLFFPNAPYILTDLIHLHPQGGAPLWYDLIVLVSFAWTGTFLGLVSLALMQAQVRDAAGAAASWVFATLVLGLSGFGVFLGRFPRWNSWDVFLNPVSLLTDMLAWVRDPLAQPRVLVFSGLFALVLATIYLTTMAFAGFLSSQRPVPAHEPTSDCPSPSWATDSPRSHSGSC